LRISQLERDFCNLPASFLFASRDNASNLGGVAPLPKSSASNVCTCFLPRVILSLDKIYHRSAAARLDRSLNACQTHLIRCARSLLFRAEADSFAIARGARRENRDSGNPVNPRAISTRTHARVAARSRPEARNPPRRNAKQQRGESSNASLEIRPLDRSAPPSDRDAWGFLGQTRARAIACCFFITVATCCTQKLYVLHLFSRVAARPGGC